MGELQKGIKNEAIRNLTLWQMAGNVIREEDAKRKDYVHVETVLKIVEEMQKEWLDIEETELPLKVRGKVDWKATAKLMEARNLIRAKWFKRWFRGS